MKGMMVGLGLMALAAGAAERAGVVPAARTLEGRFSEADMRQFAAPEKVFGPETWFHFIGGNVAAAGVTADLEALAGAGISGVQFFHGQFGGAWPGVEPQIKCLSEPWDGLVRHVADECERLGLRFTMQNCPGWAMSGGPWIAPSNAMRQLVWSRTDVAGGAVKAALAVPQPSGEEWRDYRDVAVVAFPRPLGDTGRALAPEAVASNRGGHPWAKCLRKEEGGGFTLEPSPEGEPAWVEATFAEEVTVRTVELPSVERFSHAWCYVPGVTVTVEAVLGDGERRQVARMEMPQSNWQDRPPISIACAEVPARTYRISISNRRPVNVQWIQLYTGARKQCWESESAWTLRSLVRVPHPEQTRAAWVEPGGIVDLTGKMDARGELAWEAPEGEWTVLRLGHVNAGKRNGPAPAEATGWECDKLSPRGAEAHFAGYIGRLAEGALAGGKLQGMLLDSWECETQTWTPGMEGAFMERSGYALGPWLPALAGYVVGDPETTGRFLRDWRVTVNGMLVDHFFGRMAQLGHEKGLAIAFETAAGDVFPGDILEYYKHADVPMCEFWHPREEAFVGSFEFKPVKPCVSAARMYGKPRVAAEAFTSFRLSWTEHPGMLKDIANIHLAEGVSHMVFHTYTHNPRTDWLPPGTAFGSGIGTPFLRGQAWWRHMPAFSAYLARCGFMQERGRPVSDVLWYVGDEVNHKPSQHAPFPEGYKYDYCNPDVLLNRLSVRDGRIMTPEGIAYRVLMLRDCERMVPETLERMAELVRKGAVLVGEPPAGLATLAGGARAEARFRRAVAALWGEVPVEAGVRQVGRGRVMRLPVEEALAELAVAPDVTGGAELMWNHRTSGDADWYFVAARAEAGFRGAAGFRSAGAVEIWDPESGTMRAASGAREEGGRTFVMLDLPPSGSCFVVFRRDRAVLAAAKAVARVERDGEPVLAAEEPWQARLVSLPEVLEARYGVLDDPERCKDVGELVRDALERGQFVVSGNNAWAQGDPARGTVKQLAVTLRRADGTEETLTGREGEALTLAERGPWPLPAVAAAADGGGLVAWLPGTYKVWRGAGEPVEVAAAARTVPVGAAGWTLAFPAGWGAPESLRLDALAAWKDLDVPAEARAFSGTAVYTAEVDLGGLAAGAPVMLDLGRVETTARVFVNGRLAGTAWAVPYRLDISGLAAAGKNSVRVEVSSPWHNRLVYDAGLPEAERKTWTIAGPGKDAALREEGLLGPVAVHVGQRLEVK